MINIGSLTKGNILYAVETDIVNQKVNLIEKEISFANGFNRISFVDGTHTFYKENYWDKIFILEEDVLYFISPSDAKRQRRIEYERMIENAKLMVKKFELELQNWVKNKEEDIK